MSSKRPKSLTKQRKEGTQEFFNKASGNKFTFSKAPINKDQAMMEVKKKVFSKIEDNEGALQDKEQKKSRKRSAFVAKLYRDDDELNELKVLGGENFDSDLEQDDDDATRKRDLKSKSKSEVKKAFGKDAAAASTVSSMKIAKLVSGPK
jgi:hypothetical protein